jgi:hypothetical protein
MKKISTIVFIVIIIFAIIFIAWEKVTAPAPEATQTATKSISDFKNATYNIDGVKITLKDGQNEQKIPGSVTITTTSYFGAESKGDLNGDGKEDTSFLLVQDGGGTGLFTYLATALKTEKGYEILNTVFIGDRIAPQNTQTNDGKVIVNYADRLPTEPMSVQPSIGVSRMFKVEGGKLVEIKGEFGN